MANTWNSTATWNTLRKSENNIVYCAVPLGTASFLPESTDAKHLCAIAKVLCVTLRRF